jgi:hypothetical protein
MVLLGLGSFVVCSFALVALIVMGGPGVWVATLVTAIYLGRRAWRWLDQPPSVRAQAPDPGCGALPAP